MDFIELPKLEKRQGEETLTPAILRQQQEYLQDYRAKKK